LSKHAKTSICDDCSLNPLCINHGLSEEQVSRIEMAVKKARVIKKGEYLYYANEPYHSVFAVRSGSFKSYSLTDDGMEQINHFFLPGDLMGMDALNTGIHPTFAVALESSSICELPKKDMELYSDQLPDLRRSLFKAMSREITDDQTLVLLLAKKNAGQRLSSWLLNLSTRFERYGYSATRFRLSMTRTEIGNYLGLTVETVSRLFTRLQHAGVLAVSGRELEITDMELLCKISNGTEELKK